MRWMFNEVESLEMKRGVTRLGGGGEKDVARDGQRDRQTGGGGERERRGNLNESRPNFLSALKEVDMLVLRNTLRVSTHITAR